MYNRNLILDFLSARLEVKPHRILRNIAWATPSHSWLKLNRDNLVNGNNFGLYVGLVRNEVREFVQAILANLGCCLVVVAKLWGAFHGLNMAWSLGHCKILL